MGDSVNILRNRFGRIDWWRRLTETLSYRPSTMQRKRIYKQYDFSSEIRHRCSLLAGGEAEWSWITVRWAHRCHGEVSSPRFCILTSSLKPMPADRKCFRMVGGTLVEGTVGDVLPALEQTQVGVSTHSNCYWFCLVEAGCRTTHGTIQEERRRIQEMAER